MISAHDARPALVFVCGHLCDERLFAAQVAELSATHACSVFVFREQESLGAMADALLREAPPTFTLIGLSMGGYVAFKVLQRAPERLSGLMLLDTPLAAHEEIAARIPGARLEVIEDSGHLCTI